jgi:hypothetical protein
MTSLGISSIDPVSAYQANCMESGEGVPNSRGITASVSAAATIVFRWVSGGSAFGAAYDAVCAVPFGIAALQFINDSTPVATNVFDWFARSCEVVRFQAPFGNIISLMRVFSLEGPREPALGQLNWKTAL